MPPRRGFTLVELLVVIGIVALLIALLMPALGKVRQSSQTLVCLSNVRQLASLVHLYALEYKGAMPYGYRGGSASRSVFELLLERNLLTRRQTFAVKDEAFVAPVANVADIALLRCPAEVRETVVNAPAWNWKLPTASGRFRNGLSGFVYTGCGPVVWDVTFAPWDGRVFSHYQFNTLDPSYAIHGYPGTAPIMIKSWPGAPTPKAIKLARVPARTWLAMDGNDTRFAASSAIFRHPKVACNFAYADGHAETHQLGDVDRSPIFVNLIADPRSVIERQ